MENFAKWFYKQSLLVKALLLLIPIVNWFVEVLVRWSAWMKTKDLITLVVAVVVTFGGAIIGWLDLIWLLLFGHLLFAKD